MLRQPGEGSTLRRWAVSAAAFTFFIVGAAACRAQAQSATAINWLGIKHAYATYMKDPSRSNALALERLLPQEHAPFEEAKGKSEAYEFIFSDRNSDFLINKVRKGDADAAGLALRLTTIADGADWERLDITLGALAEKDPRLFLSLVKEDGIFAEEQLSSLLGNLGPRYVDKMGAQCRELKKRTRILLKVNDPDLTATRDKALEALRKNTDEVCQYAREGVGK